MLNDLIESFEKLVPLFKEKKEAEELALRAEIAVRELSGLPPVDLDERDAIAILKSICLLLERFQTYPKLLNRQEVDLDPVEIHHSIDSQPVCDTSKEIFDLKPSTTAQELIKLRDWVLLANSSEIRENVSNKVLDAIYERLGSILENEGVASLHEIGKFDYEIHKIVSTRSTEDPEEDDLICDVVRPGYLFNGLLIRPQEVIVYSYEKKAN
jgi:hypothetical protein